MTRSPFPRKLVLTIHIMVSVGLLGIQRDTWLLLSVERFH
jgi:hypothetical protein